MQCHLQVQGYLISLYFSHAWKQGWKQDLSLVPPVVVLVKLLWNSKDWGWLSITIPTAISVFRTLFWDCWMLCSLHCLHSSRVSSLALQYIAFQHNLYTDTTTEMQALGLGQPWSGLLGHYFRVYNLSISLCYSSPGYFSFQAALKSMFCVRDRRQGVNSSYCTFHMA